MPESRRGEEISSAVRDYVKAGIIIYDPEIKIRFVNAEACRMLGASREQLVGSGVLQRGLSFCDEDGGLIPSEELPVQRVFATHEPVFDMVLGIVSKEGEVSAWALASAFPQLSRDGSLTRVVLTFTDITERRRAELRQEHLTNVLRAIRNVNQLIAHEKDRSELLRRSCELLTEARGYSSVWIATRGEDGTLQAEAQSGVEHGFDQMRAQMESGEPPACLRRTAGNSAMLVAEDRTELCAGCVMASSYRDQGVFARALRSGEREYGVLVAVLPPSLAGEREEQSLFREVADDIGLALGAIEADHQRRTATEALAESEALFRGTFEQVAVGMAQCDLEGRWLRLNQRTCDILGYTREELIGSSLQQYFHPDEVDTNQEALEQLLAGTVPSFTIETRFVRRDRTVVPVGVTLSFVEDAGGRPRYLIAVIEDITERRAAEGNLIEIKTTLETALDSMSDAVFISDVDGNLINFNDAFVTFHKFKHKGECSRTFAEYPQFLEVFFPDGRPAPVDQWAVPRALRGETVTNTEYSLRRTDTGETWDGAYSFAPLRDDSGAITGSVVVARDITEHKRAEVALKESEDRFRALVQGAPDGIYVQHDERFLFVNPAMTSMLGASTPEELLGADVIQRIPRRYHAQIRRRKGEKGRGKGFGPAAELEFLRLDGEQVPVEVSTVDLRFQGKDATLVFVRDIRGRKEAEAQQTELQEQLLQAQKMESVGRLAGGVAHDFNNLLTVQRGYCELLRNGLAEDDPLARGLAQIDSCAVRASDLTRQLLAFSRKQALEPKVFDMNTLVGGLNRMLKRLIGEDVDLITMQTQSKAMVRADPGQIEQVLINLAVNARDAMATGGTLRIEVELVELDDSYTDFHREVEPGPYVMLAVSDTGSGMDEETKRQIFEPFFTTKEEGVGTGLGLSTVYGIIHQSGGTIWVYSEPDRGTTFKVYLPQVEEEVTSQQKEGGSIARGNGELILVVEDELALRELAQMMIEDLGYEVVVTANGGEALLQVEERNLRPDVVLTDVVLPGMSGRVLVERLARTLPDVKVIYMSGYTDDAVVRHGILESDIEFLQKPFTIGALAKKLADTLGKD